MSEPEHGIVTVVAEDRPGFPLGPALVRRDETELVLSRVPESERARVADEATQILRKCVAAVGSGDALRTGLVVGLIQSGKTLSFTTVAALARDNGYPLVILIAGISQLLLDQSRARLRSDLELERDAYRRWYHVRSPSLEGPDRKNIEAALRDWHDPNVSDDDRPTVLLTVMKNWAQLGKLADVLEKLDLRGTTALLIDDEADQASLNTRWKRGEESSTHFQLMRVRHSLPRHTLLQYTATPQAPLLLSLADSLSPDFASVLQPGAEYVGGADFFGGDDRYVRLLGAEDTDVNVAERREPPPGLLEALKVFFIGAMAAQMSKQPNARRSMLIHPSRTVAPQARFEAWVRRATELWQSLLDRPAPDPDRMDLVRLFALAHEELSKTASLPPLDDLLLGLARLIRRTRIEVLNATAGGTASVEWGAAPAWILIGGQLLDRGFTVEGLSVTYMSRPTGMGHADTLQQRARFYGYKRSYLATCRVYLEPGLRDSLSVYVRHEQDMRRTLADLAAVDQPLQHWKRAFLLDPILKPSRASVLSLPHTHSVISDGWQWQRFPHASDTAMATNRRVLQALTAGRQTEWTSGSTPFQRHRRYPLALRELLDFLSQYVIADGHDSAGFSGALMQIAAYLDEGDDKLTERAFLFEMRPSLVVTRAVTDRDSVEQLFEGRSAGYVGDDHVVEAGAVCVQYHELSLHRKQSPEVNIASGVPTLAIWLPKRMAQGWVVQDAPDA